MSLQPVLAAAVAARAVVQVGQRDAAKPDEVVQVGDLAPVEEVPRPAEDVLVGDGGDLRHGGAEPEPAEEQEDDESCSAVAVRSDSSVVRAAAGLLPQARREDP